jgi:hypothetical protein
MKKYFTLAMVFVFLVLLIPVYGQEPEPEEESLGVPINSPKTEQEERDSRAARSFSNTIAWNERNRFGFSLGASEGRISDVYPNSVEPHPSMLTAFSGGIFANFGRHKSQLHLDANAGYRMYHQQDGMDGADYYGNLTYTYQANRKTRFRLSDIFSSALNDPFSSLGTILRDTNDWTPSPAYSVVFMPQRLTQNGVKAEVGLDLTRSTHFGLFGSYDSYRYAKQEYSDTDGVQVGANLNQRITSWMFLASTYSTYLGKGDQRLRDYQIHRLEIGRFQFMLSRDMELFFSGGIEVADTLGDYRTQGMFRAGISRSSEKNVIYANYQRTMVTALGYSRILPSDMVTLGIGQRLTDRTSLRLSGAYLRSSDFDYSGLLTGYYARAQFEYALRSDFFASINYAFQYQKNTITTLPGIPHFDRSVVFLSLQYAWPSIRLRSE